MRELIGPEKAFILHNLDEQEQALGAANRAISLKPNLSSGWTEKARSMHDLVRNSDALVAINQAAKLNNWTERNGPTSKADALQLRARILNSLGQYQEAADQLTSVLAVNPLLNAARTDRIKACIQLHRWQLVVDDCTVVLRASERTHTKEILGLRAQAYFHLQNYRQAAADYQSVLEMAPADRKLHAALLETYTKLNDAEGVAREKKQSPV